MGAPTALITDQYSLPVAGTVPVTADVAVTPVNTYVDIATFGTLPAGLYQISGQITVAQITATAVVTYKFLDGAAIFMAGEASVAVGAGLITIPAFNYNHLASGIIKVQAASTVLTSTVKKVALNNGAGTDNFVTFISFLRIG